MLQHDYHDFVGFSSVEHNDLPILWIEKLSKNRSRFSHHPFFGSSAWWWSWNWNLLCESFQKSFFSEEKKKLVVPIENSLMSVVVVWSVTLYQSPNFLKERNTIILCCQCVAVILLISSPFWESFLSHFSVKS